MTKERKIEIAKIMGGEALLDSLYQHPETGDIDTLSSWLAATEDFSDDDGPDDGLTTDLDQALSLIPVPSKEVK